MEITLNNKKEELPGDEMTIEELLAYKKFTFKMLVIKVNGKIIKRHEYSTTTIKDGDNVIVLHLVSGG
ncbi:MAG: hypothetical protein Kow0068_23280 [Marinilabiliales bacterium]